MIHTIKKLLIALLVSNSIFTRYRGHLLLKTAYLEKTRQLSRDQCFDDKTNMSKGLDRGFLELEMLCKCG